MHSEYFNFYLDMVILITDKHSNACEHKLNEFSSIFFFIFKIISIIFIFYFIWVITENYFRTIYI